MKFSTYLQDYKSKNNLTMKQLAEKLDISWRTVESWLQGLNVPRKLTIEAVKQILRNELSENYLSILLLLYEWQQIRNQQMYICKMSIQ